MHGDLTKSALDEALAQRRTENRAPTGLGMREKGFSPERGRESAALPLHMRRRHFRGRVSQGA